MSDPRDPLTYFSDLADDYAAHRPSYPAEAIAAILDGLPAEARVADVGCGTGIASTLLADAGAAVIGIEPNEEMRRRALDRRSPRLAPRLDYRFGTAERTGLPDAAVDAVVCAQSFHWFDVEPALREFRRILRPGGRLALMWNIRVAKGEFDRIYAETVVEAQQDARRHGRLLRRDYGVDLGELGPHFHHARRLTWPNPQVCTLEALLGKARSASYFPREGPLVGELLGRLTAAFHAHQRDGVVTVNQECSLTLAQRAD